MREVSKDKKSAISEVLRTVDLIKYTANAASNIYLSIMLPRGKPIIIPITESHRSAKLLFS